MRSRPDYERKARVLDSGLYLDYKKFQRSVYSAYARADLKNVYPLSVAYSMADYYLNQNEDDWNECKRIYNASKCRKKRLNNRIALMLQKPCVFVTLTFTDKVLSNTSEETRHAYIKRFLKETADNYVANIDYGLKNEREHYHALIQIEKINCLSWKYGNLDVKRVKSANDSLKLSTYIVKLTNHAVKNTNKKAKVIYSR